MKVKCEAPLLASNSVSCSFKESQAASSTAPRKICFSAPSKCQAKNGKCEKSMLRLFSRGQTLLIVWISRQEHSEQAIILKDKERHSFFKAKHLLN